MDHATNPIAYFTAYAVAIFVSRYLHEGSHWAIGKLGGTKPTVDWGIVRWIWPQAIRHENMETMDGELIRFSGLSVFLWLPPWVLSLGLLAEEITPWTLLMSLTPFLVVFGMATESDALAFRNPEKYRECALNDDLPGGPLFNPVIVIVVLILSVVYPLFLL